MFQHAFPLNGLSCSRTPRGPRTWTCDSPPVLTGVPRLTRRKQTGLFSSSVHQVWTGGFCGLGPGRPVSVIIGTCLFLLRGRRFNTILITSARGFAAATDAMNTLSGRPHEHTEWHYLGRLGGGGAGTGAQLCVGQRTHRANPRPTTAPLSYPQAGELDPSATGTQATAALL